MGFFTLLEVASMPVIQVLLIGTLGAFMSTDYLKLLSTDTRKSLNKIVFVVFTPALMFASLSKTVTWEDITAWWFMLVNIGLTFLFGGFLGWVAVKILKPKPHLEGLIIATCASGNLGNLVLIIVPAVCKEDGSPFGNDHQLCSSTGLSYASLSMALGGFYIWTYAYQLIKSSSDKYQALQANHDEEEITTEKTPNKDLESDGKTLLLLDGGEESDSLIVISSKEETDLSKVVVEDEKKSVLGNVVEMLHQILEELMSPPTIAAIIGFIFGAIPWLKELLIGDEAPLRVIQDSVKLLGDGTIPCITLILGGNLVQGLRSSSLRPSTTIAVICVKYLFLPVIGMGVVKTAAWLGFLSDDPLYHYVLMVQFALPPAMNISTMTQLFDVAQEECSVLFLWTYLVACVSLTVWSTIFMWILS